MQGAVLDGNFRAYRNSAIWAIHPAILVSKPNFQGTIGYAGISSALDVPP